MKVRYYSFDSNIGKLRLYFNKEAIVGLSFFEEGDNYKYIKRYYGDTVEVCKDDYSYHEEVIKYLEGKLKEFTVAFLFKGTSFQKKVWNELLSIPYGQTRTYKDIAENINCPKAYRAVGSALNKNPIAIIVPCHRVVGSSGKLVGFAGGLDVKEKLLMLEKRNV